VSAFFDRLRVLRPDITLFVRDTTLRLTEKVVPMRITELTRRSRARAIPHRIERELWALTPHLPAVNSGRDLIANVGRAIAEGLVALARAAPQTKGRADTARPFHACR